MNKPEDYKFIKHWHETTGSKPYYWRALQEDACQDNAPLTAICRGHNGTWIVLDDCTWPEEVKRKFMLEANK
ncbi:MAG: hypothetical protein WBG19_00240 [Thermoplasmata archaeon]